MIHTGDCLEVMRTLPEASVDAVVTDPPYLLQFMGKSWDGPAQMSGHNDPTLPEGHGGKAHDHGVAGHWQPHWMQAWHEAWGREALRVTVPGGYLLAFGGTRTHHRLVCGLEDAGWIIRDELDWIYASGFPKGKANLKPAHEPIVLARKPGPLRMLNIDGCRIPGTTEATRFDPGKHNHDGYRMDATGADVAERTAGFGRWPANVILTDPVFDGGVDGVVGGGAAGDFTEGRYRREDETDGLYGFGGRYRDDNTYGDSGTYSRFFLIPKADRADREPVLRGHKHEWQPAGLIQGLMHYVCRVCGRRATDGRTTKAGGEFTSHGRTASSVKHAQPRENGHPTVKPLELMRHLVRLVTPPGGTVLDPFLGSGTTAIACEMEGFAWIGVEKEIEYVKIAEARLNGVQRGLGLPA